MKAASGGSPAASLPNRSATWAGSARLLVLILALLALVLVPFAIWGEALEQSAPQWLQSRHGLVWLALLGITLLIADVLLPIPASVVSVALCWSLGPLIGGSAVAIGTFLSFATGYGLGRVLPEARLRRWIGVELWDRLRHRAGQADAWWIILCRPLPVLAELSAILAGVWRLPMTRTLSQAALASMVVGALYGISAWLGTQAPSMGLSLLALLCLPVGFWLVHRFWLQRLSQRREEPTQP